MSAVMSASTQPSWAPSLVSMLCTVHHYKTGTDPEIDLDLEADPEIGGTEDDALQ